MYTFVFDDDKDIETEAAQLSTLIETHYETLRLDRLGEKVCLGKTLFELIALNRNAVYRIRAMRGWYLKLPVSESSSLVEHELLGAQAAHHVLRGHREYLAPTLIRIPSERRYVLTAEVPGGYLHSTLYGVCIRPWTRPSNVLQGFEGLGKVLGGLHKYSPTTEMPASTTPAASAKLRQALNKTSQRDAICDAVEKWLDRLPSVNDQSFVHGNLRRENILFYGGRVGLIDFETCGVGSRYDDLSLLSSNFALTRAAAIFPWRRVFLAWASLLQGYREMFAFDRQELRKKTLIQLATNYAWILAGKPVTVAKIPISKRRLANMIQASLRGDWQTAFPGIDW